MDKTNFSEMCLECLQKNENPESDCCETVCKCECHWTEEDIASNELANKEGWEELNGKERGK